MEKQEALLAALTRAVPGFDKDAGRVRFVDGERGVLLTAYAAQVRQPVARLFLDTASQRVYQVPSSVSGVQRMDEIVADPDRRATLAVV